MAKKVPVVGIISLIALWTALIGGGIYVVNIFSSSGTHNSSDDTSLETVTETEIPASDAELPNEPEFSNLNEEQSYEIVDSEINTDECDTNYVPCVDDVLYDLDCADVGFQVRVVGVDTHNLDGDGDGYGCESY